MIQRFEFSSNGRTGTGRKGRKADVIGSNILIQPGQKTNLVNSLKTNSLNRVVGVCST